MGFDLTTAKPEAAGFDLSTAKPAQGATVNGEAPGMMPTFVGSIGKGISSLALAGPKLAGRALSAMGAESAGKWVQNAVDQSGSTIETTMAPYKAANPLTAAAGEITGQVIATAPVGGALAGGLRAVAPVLSAGRAAPIINAIESAGMRTGAAPAATVAGKAADLGARAIGGGVTGGVSSAIIDAEHAGTGAAVGAAMPVVISSLGAGGRVAAAAWRGMMQSGDIAGAKALAKALDAATPQAQASIIEQLRNAETLVPGASPTVAQALRSPEAGITNRVVYDSPGGAPLRAKIAEQAAARRSALEGVAPTDANGFASARTDMGDAIASRVIPEENAITRLIRQQYASVDPAKKEAIQLPISQMQSAVDKYAGRGTFGNNSDAVTALNTAKSLAKPVESAQVPQIVDAAGNPLREAANAVPRAASWDEVGNLRASINKALRDAKLDGDRQAQAALTAQKNSIDSAIDANLSPQAKAAWLEANASHAGKMDRFHTGPQKAIFRTGPDGLPVAEGGEVAAKFWGKGAGAAENVASFRKLIDDNPALLGQFKSMITTQGAGTADAAGNLTTKFSKWVSQSLPGLRGAFTADEVKTLQNLAADLDRNAASMKAGTSLGGSNTYQNSANALDLGMLDSPALAKVAGMIPGVKYVSGPALEGIKGSARNAKAAKLAGLLADSERAANALERLTQTGAPPRRPNPLLELLGPAAYRAAPVVGSR